MTNVSQQLDWRLKRQIDNTPLLDKWLRIAYFVGDTEAVKEIEKRKEVLKNDKQRNS